MERITGDGEGEVLGIKRSEYDAFRAKQRLSSPEMEEFYRNQDEANKKRAEEYKRQNDERKKKRAENDLKYVLYDVNYKNNDKIVQFDACDRYYIILGKCFEAHFPVPTVANHCDPDKWKVVIQKGIEFDSEERDLEEYIQGVGIGEMNFWKHHGGGGFIPIFFLREKEKIVEPELDIEINVINYGIKPKVTIVCDYCGKIIFCHGHTGHGIGKDTVDFCNEECHKKFHDVPKLNTDNTALFKNALYLRKNDVENNFAILKTGMDNLVSLLKEQDKMIEGFKISFTKNNERIGELEAWSRDYHREY